MTMIIQSTREFPDHLLIKYMYMVLKKTALFLLEFHHSPAGEDTNTPSPPVLMEKEHLLFED